ncbi:Uncharacterised protein [Shigella sonnei]|nr:Uncharacterised protein [Shigella sonnei]CST22906.1 Uncharacterised protein [Shigella sonnei]
MKFIVQVGNGEMHFAIQRIGRWRDRCRIGYPHWRSGADAGKPVRCLACNFFQYLLIATTESQLTQHRNKRTLVRRDHGLGESRIGKGFHFQ